MSTIVFIAIVSVVALLAAGALLLAAWLLGLALRWALGFALTTGMPLALGALGIVAVIVHAAISRSVPWPFHLPLSDEDDDSEDDGEDDSEDDAKREAEGWMTPCPCGSGRPFAYCCGKRAYRHRH